MTSDQTGFDLAESVMPLAKARHLRDMLGAQALYDKVLKTARAAEGNAVIATSDAAALLAQGPLAGIPFGVKDNIDCLPFPTTGGSPGLLENLPEVDAPPVARLKAAGAYVPFKLNLHELAFGITSNNAHFGAVSTPFDPTRVAGGSSGGSAAAVARGLIPFALGTDTGGSTRIPAAFCGVVGFRPSVGRYPDGGVLTLSTTRDTVGPIASCVADLQEVDGLIVPDDSETPGIDRPLRIGLIYRHAGLSNAVDARFEQAVTALEAAGLAQFVTLSDTVFDGLEQQMGQAIVVNEAHRVWTDFCQNRLGKSLTEFAETIGSPDVRGVFSALPDLLEPTAEPFAAAHAGGGLARLRSAYADLFDRESLDLIAMPTVPVQPPLIGEDETIETDQGPQPTFPTVIRNTSLASLTGAPSLSLPAGLDRDGLPVGFMVEARAGHDRFLLAAAARLETILKR
ncbi:amidase family protein [Ruegeria sp. HKCCD7255]|uniref:amidase family protein n=1 Tax=Ruegeria sp. HKCCD7255 TaxID=2683004 RepID=UPI0014895049|nr:amidase family protein [Ruegeria sp. HKCCD7255]